ncbi:hypothetical protein [Nocardia pseudovaccinii]|uniref:hypothetical protein n=1 Tax=Nocardia pseudovaccinii TaxID=189540 RepID=UPI0007A4E306|nr:hypothetical protein [Nocardia pseudovaccinii]
MTNYSEEIERIFEEHDRRSRMLREELVEIEQRSAERGRDFVEQMNEEMRTFWEERAEELEKAQAEADERERRETEARAEQERLAAEAREQREAIARSIAARKAHDVVTPIDEDDDPESEYYRRKSWLI